jgi:hypothetical protein
MASLDRRRRDSRTAGTANREGSARRARMATFATQRHIKRTISSGIPRLPDRAPRHGMMRVRSRCSTDLPGQPRRFKSSARGLCIGTIGTPLRTDRLLRYRDGVGRGRRTRHRRRGCGRIRGPLRGCRHRGKTARGVLCHRRRAGILAALSPSPNWRAADVESAALGRQHTGPPLAA